MSTTRFIAVMHPPRVYKHLASDENWARPTSFIKDDLAAESSTLEVGPHPQLLLCHFHVLKAVWRWLWGLKNGTCENDLKTFMHKFRAVLYAEDQMKAEQLSLEFIKI